MSIPESYLFMLTPGLPNVGCHNCPYVIKILNHINIKGVDQLFCNFYKQIPKGFLPKYNVEYDEKTEKVLGNWTDETFKKVNSINHFIVSARGICNNHPIMKDIEDEKDKKDGKYDPLLSSLGLSIIYGEDACWLTFKASNNCEATINLSLIANESNSSIVKNTILQWIEDNWPKEEEVVAPDTKPDNSEENKLIEIAKGIIDGSILHSNYLQDNELDYFKFYFYENNIFNRKEGVTDEQFIQFIDSIKDLYGLYQYRKNLIIGLDNKKVFPFICVLEENDNDFVIKTVEKLKSKTII